MLVVPEAGETVIQLAPDATLHGAHDPSFGLTVTVTPRWLLSADTTHVLPFRSGAFALNAYVQPTGETVAVNVWLAMVAVMVCCAVVVFGDAVTVTLPLPDPDVGATDSAALAVEADHPDGAHPKGAAVTLTTCEPPPAAKFAVDGEIANVHALFVGVGWVVEGVREEDGPLQAAIATIISETANVLVRFIARNYTSLLSVFYRAGICGGHLLGARDNDAVSSWTNKSGAERRFVRHQLSRH